MLQNGLCDIFTLSETKLDESFPTAQFHITYFVLHRKDRNAHGGGVIVARLSKSLATLTLGSSKINQHCWRFHGSGVIAAPQIIGLISFCTGMHHEYFFEVANVLSCSPFMFENNENKQLDWRIRHSHLASTLFHSLVRWWRPRRIRPQITRLSQLENSAIGARGQFTRTLFYQTDSKNGVI